MDIRTIVELAEFEQDQYLYFLACKYMAETEIFDRGLPHCASQHDETEAFVHPRYRPLSNLYAKTVRKAIIEEMKEHSYLVTWDDSIKDIIHRNHFTAQGWIEEYERLLQGGKYSGQSRIV